MQIIIYRLEDWEICFVDGELFHNYHRMDDEQYTVLLRKAGVDVVEIDHRHPDNERLEQYLREHGRFDGTTLSDMERALADVEKKEFLEKQAQLRGDIFYLEEQLLIARARLRDLE